MADDLKTTAPSQEAPRLSLASAAAPHAMAPGAVAESLASDLRNGLAPAEAGARRARYGPNQLEATGGARPFTILLRQFANALVLILAAAALSVFMGHFCRGGGGAECLRNVTT